MKQLSEFDTIEEAKSYLAPRERMISHDMMVSFLTKKACITTLQNSDDEYAKGFWLAVSSGVEEFNLMNSSSVGIDQQELLTHLVVSVGAVSQDFADTCISYANGTYKPYKSVTLYAFKHAKGQLTYRQVAPDKGWIKITVTEECEPHAPQIYADIQGVMKRVAGFETISKVGQYVAQVPMQYGDLYVANPYGVI